MKIHLLKHADIDYVKWDICVEQSHNSLIYAYSWFLDVVSPGWEALIGGDYEYVMPLPVKKKLGVKYIVQPFLTQQLGVFSNLLIDEAIVSHFIREIPYLSYSINMNEGNFYSKAVEQPNYVLDLNFSKESLFENFSKNSKRNIKKARELSLSIDYSIGIDDFLEFYHEEKGDYAKIDELVIRKLIETLAQKRVLKIVTCRDKNGIVVAAVCLICWEKRIINLLPVSSKAGKEMKAMFLIMNQIVEQHAEREILLDFEGSRVEGVARFYRGFGPKNQPYYTIERCRPKRFVNLISKK